MTCCTGNVTEGERTVGGLPLNDVVPCVVGVRVPAIPLGTAVKALRFS